MTDPGPQLAETLVEMSIKRMFLPDALLAGSFLALPAHENTVMPFLCANTELTIAPQCESPFGVAFAHLLFAIELIQLGEVPWSRMIGEAAGTNGIHEGLTPIRGRAFTVDPNRCT